VGGPGGGVGPGGAGGGGSLRRLDSTRWLIEPGPPGWVVLPEEYSPGWRIGGRPGYPTVAGTVAVWAGSGTALVEYRPWRWLRLGITVSLLTLAALVVAGLIEHRREWPSFFGLKPLS
jgi:hypothetical protein